MRPLHLCICLAAVLAVFQAAYVHAVAFSYAGFITEVYAEPRAPDGLVPGAPFTATLTIQDNFQPIDAHDDPNIGSYEVRSNNGTNYTSAVYFQFDIPGTPLHSSARDTDPVWVENQTAFDRVGIRTEATQFNGIWYFGYDFLDPSATALASDAWTSNFLRQTWPEIGIVGYNVLSGTRFRGVVASVGAFLTRAHPNAGLANIYLNPAGAPAIESRSGGASGNHTIFFVFDRSISSALAAVTSGIGSVDGPLSFQGRTVVVNLTGVADDQYLTVKLTNVMDTTGQTVPDASATAGFLIGDANGDGTVNSGDAAQVRTRSGAALNVSNPPVYRCDFNGDGSINAGDAFIARSRSGNSLLP